MTSYPVGLLEAVTEVVSEEDTDLAGFYQTRLTAALETGTALTAVYTWNGTLTITTSDTSEVIVGDWIRLDEDGQYFKIDSIILNTSVTVLNPENLVVPSGATSSSKAVTSFPVETTHGWSDSGKIGIGGVVYSYASKTDTSFDGITFTQNLVVIPGAGKQHRQDSPVVDLNKDRTALELVRRGLLVDYAESDELNALGRNLGVLRLPFIESDDRFREIIKALAYNPKGTIYGIELALNGLVGEGNYSIYEDLINYPNTVFINLIGSATTEDTSEGKAFLTAKEHRLAASDTTVTISQSVADKGVVGGVFWKDEDHTTETQLQKPSADVITEYVGDPGTNPWTFAGSNEATQITLHTTDSGSIEFVSTTTCFYFHIMRIQAESRAEMGTWLKHDTGTTLDVLYKWGLSISDGTKKIEVGIANVNSVTVKIGFADLGTGLLISGATSTNVPKNVYYDLRVVKHKDEYVTLLINGAPVQTLPYSSFSSTTFTFCVIGSPSGLTNPPNTHVKKISYVSRTLTDYYSERGSVGSLVNPDRLDTGVSTWTSPTDEGKKVHIYDSITNPSGGNGNGVWTIDSVISASIVELIGATNPNAYVESANPTYITVPTDGQLFQFPDDLGKEVEILNSTLGHNGTWVIGDLIQRGSGASLKNDFDTVVPEKTNIAVLTGASFGTETGLNWRLLPNFTAESNVNWEAAAMGSVSGTTVTLPNALPITSGSANRVLSVIYSQVISAQMLLDATLLNAIIATVPDIEWRYYPVYLADPLGYVRSYLEDLTAAGVIPDFRFI